MYAGRIVEQADTETVFKRPLHPYTRGLFRSVASLREGCGTLETIPGVVPNLHFLPAGCSFSLRCGQCRENCEKNMPELLETGPGHKVRCFLTEKEGAE
jgi:peptide/nickel transport system ATP-binding protein